MPVVGLQSSYQNISSYGEVSYLPEIIVTVDFSKVIGVNNLSTGFQISYGSGDFMRNSQMRQLAEDANFKLVRFTDWLASQWIPSMMPCTRFNEQTKTGTYNWTNVDNVVGKIFQIGAEPLVCLGGVGGVTSFPPGMAINSTTNLPNPESYAVYCTDWVKHFKEVGLPVRYYEVVNEPWVYFGWEPVNFTRLNNYMSLFNACAGSMRQQNPNLFISFDFVGRKPVLDYWLANGGADVDSINFHKYGDYVAGRKSDEDLFATAENEYFGQWPLGYSVSQARQVWFNARGKLLPIICSESNFNSAWQSGTDPRIQQMAGAVWTALVLRMGVLSGVNYNVYFELASSANYGKTTETGGAGFGMVNSDNNQPWYPYYVHCMLGNSLGVGDSLIEAVSSSDDIRTLAWIHNRTLNIFLICKVDQPRILQLRGLESKLNFFKIDKTFPWETPSIQTGVVNSTEPCDINGYTVALLQTPAPP